MSKENTNILNRSFRIFSDNDDQQTIATYQTNPNISIQNNRDAVLEHLHEEILEHFKNSFEEFAEEWTEIKPLGKIKRTTKSAKIDYSVHLIDAENFEFENTLVSAYFYDEGGDELAINEVREEVLITDGVYKKLEEDKTQNRQDYTTYKKQKIIISQPDLVILLRRKRVRNDHKSYEHHDQIEVHVRGEEKYLIIKDYIQSLGN